MIYGRRNVHRMLAKLAEFLDPIRVRELEGKLETESGQTRAAEWEVAIGFALSHAGKVGDFDQPSGRNPDYIWTPGDLPIVVEVTTLSDVALHDQNPVRQFTSELYRVATKLGVAKYGTLNYSFGSLEDGGRVAVAVPAKKEHVSFFSRPATKAFFEQIKQQPDHQHTYTFVERGAESSITYLPGQGRFSSTSYRSYTAPQTYRHNPVFNALKKKEKQIRDSETKHPAILFICDNDCDALRQAHTSTAGDRLGMRDIVGLFLNGQRLHKLGDLIWKQGISAQANRVHAVIWISVKENWMPFTHSSALTLSPHIEYADYAEPYLRSDEFLGKLNQALSSLPAPQQTPRNAGVVRRYPAHYGRWKMSAMELSFSALTLQKLLIGEISHEEFSRAHPELMAQLKRFSDQGMMLDFASIQPCDHEDDDWISLRFHGRNPEKLFSQSTQEIP